MVDRGAEKPHVIRAAREAVAGCCLARRRRAPDIPGQDFALAGYNSSTEVCAGRLAVERYGSLVFEKHW